MGFLSGSQQCLELVAQERGGFVPCGGNADCRKVHRTKSCVTARVDAIEGFQVHGDVQREAMVGAVAGDLDAQGGNLAEAGKQVPSRGGAGQGLVRRRVRRAHVDAGRAVASFGTKQQVTWKGA